MKKYIYAMSKSRRDVGADLEQGCDELIMHLIKLRIYPDSQECNHWRKEVAEKLHRVDSFKGSHKLPSVQFILHNTYFVHASRITHYIDIVKKDYEYNVTSCSIDVLLDDIRDYFEWLANQLAETGRVAYTDIIEHLKNSGF